MARITTRDPSAPALCGVCGDHSAMDTYWLCLGCASIEEHHLERAEYHSGRAEDLRGAKRLVATLAADQADSWASALAAEWSH